MKNFQEKLFSKEVNRVRISPSGSSIIKSGGQNILNVTLLPEEGDEEDGEIVLMRLTKDGEDYLFETIEDDEEFNKVEAYIQSLEDDEEEGDDGLTV